MDGCLTAGIRPSVRIRSRNMLDRVGNLAQFLVARRTMQDKCVLMLGAGASLSSGVPPTAAIMAELVEQYGRGLDGSLEDRFDALWRQQNGDSRLLMLEPYLNRAPGAGYRHLARMIAEGYFDIVITFNFDRLLETALDHEGFRDYRVLVRGETTTEAVARLVQSPQPRVKILKLHGSLQSADYFLFSKEEMLNYPPDLAAVIGELTGRDIVICGYAFNDVCVVRAFNDSGEAGAIHYVNPSGAGENIKGFLLRRRSRDRVISGDLGRFDEFCAALHDAVTRPEPPQGPVKQNHFKFLDHYQEGQSAWFLGRHKLTRALARRLENGGSGTLFLYGKPKVGKTSFVRAGLIPHLDPERYDCVYLRCQRELEPHLRSVLERRYPEIAGLAWERALPRLREVTPKRVVLLLDQFERVARGAEGARDAKQALVDFMGRLFAHTGPHLSVVCVSIEESAFLKLLLQFRTVDLDPVEIEALTPARVARIVRYWARRGGVTIPSAELAKACAEYERGLTNPSDRDAVTLTHLQTFCYYLARGGFSSWDGYKYGSNPGLLAVLDSLREESSLVDLLDDLPEDERRMIRSFLKLLCDPASNTRKIVEFIRDHFPDIREDRFPEPLA